MKRFSTLVSFFLIFTPVFSQPFHPLPTINNPPLFNDQLHYTSSLLNQPNREVRILIYGQSISVQQWWKEVKAYFEKKYPNTKFNIVNKSIGGFSTERLKITTANDIASFYPDLILFHDYGNEQDYEKIIRIIQSKTTADIAIQTDHMANQGQEWHNHHSDVWMPELCKKYGLALLDIRKYWKQYLKDNNLQIKDLVVDGIHLNNQGNYLMAAIIENYFDNLSYGGASDNRMKILKRGKDFSVKKDILTLSFTGNRIDVQADASAKAASIGLVVDQQSLETNKGCYYYTRPTRQSNNSFLTKIGFLIAMDLSDKVQEEDWSLTIISIDSVQQQVVFSIKGSKTGEDGTGNSIELFTSKSGKITIKPDYWFIRRNEGDFSQYSWLQPGDVLQWQTKCMCHESAVLTPSSIQTLFQGISNTKHQLTITGQGAKHIKEIVVYTPVLPNE
ncbi:MAG: hypothetical protein ABI813_16665 [Bacteroidota bacterium]